MAILNYKIVPKKEDEAKLQQQQEAQKKEAQAKSLRASKQSVVNNAMLTKVPDNNPTQTAPTSQAQGWGGTQQ